MHGVCFDNIDNLIYYEIHENATTVHKKCN